MPKSEAQGLPISLNYWLIIQSFFHNGGDCSISSLMLASYATISGFGDSVAFEILFVRLASDIRTVEEAFCVLVLKFLVDNVLAVFDGISCGNQHVNTASV